MTRFKTKQSFFFVVIFNFLCYSFFYFFYYLYWNDVLFAVASATYVITVGFTFFCLIRGVQPFYYLAVGLSISCTVLFFTQSFVGFETLKFPDTIFYMRNSLELLGSSIPNSVLSSDMGFTVVVAGFRFLNRSEDFLLFCIFLFNLASILLSGYFMFRDKRFCGIQLDYEIKFLGATIFLFFPGLFFYPGLILKECIFLFLFTISLIYSLRKEYIYSNLLASTMFFFRPFYAATLYMFWFLKIKFRFKILLIFFIFLIVFYFGFTSLIIRIYYWCVQVFLSFATSDALDIQKNTLLAFFFPSPFVNSSDIYFNKVYSFGAFFYYSIFPLALALSFRFRIFPFGLFIILFISFVMSILGIGIFRSKIPLAAAYITFLVSIFHFSPRISNLYIFGSFFSCLMLLVAVLAIGGS